MEMETIILILISLLMVFVTIGMIVLRQDIDKLQQILKEKEMTVIRLSDTNEYNNKLNVK